MIYHTNTSFLVHHRQAILHQLFLVFWFLSFEGKISRRLGKFAVQIPCRPQTCSLDSNLLRFLPSVGEAFRVSGFNVHRKKPCRFGALAWQKVGVRPVESMERQSRLSLFLQTVEQATLSDLGRTTCGFFENIHLIRMTSSG